ncbi:hypothetical protein GCM10025771_20250 [Niveibacterium umoris]|uniref:Putative nucleic acid-binding Zn-ribbon protein n=1 Tax=Niveibacterium umoris TaxID=1193620 RepID=A0A840BHS7_9RHOO|nr:hypothetical protein [Niveibacterium umoris]MBB4012785.1 putative nucleic acid-binding Zn-ribbon protein [Niveibacterium umoris]
MSKRDEYIDTMKHQLDEMNANMDVLEAKAQAARDDARDKYKAELAKLRQQSKLALAKLDELKTAGEESWDKITDEMEKVRDAFIHSFRYFRSQL